MVLSSFLKRCNRFALGKWDYPAFRPGHRRTTATSNRSTPTTRECLNCKHRTNLLEARVAMATSSTNTIVCTVTGAGLPHPRRVRCPMQPHTHHPCRAKCVGCLPHELGTVPQEKTIGR